MKTIPQKKKCKKAKWLSEEGLQIAVKRPEAEEKEMISQNKQVSADVINILEAYKTNQIKTQTNSREQDHPEEKETQKRKMAV